MNKQLILDLILVIADILFLAYLPENAPVPELLTALGYVLGAILGVRIEASIAKKKETGIYSRY